MIWRVSATASTSDIERVSVAITVVPFTATPSQFTGLLHSRRTSCPFEKAIPAISAAPVMSSAMTIIPLPSYIFLFR